MSHRALVESRLTQAMAQRSMNQMEAIRHVTQTALAEVSHVHRHAIQAAERTLNEAERTQRLNGKPLDDPVFQGLTVGYLDEITSITERAGTDMLRIIDRALR
jgi:hypothetical protein